MDFRYRLKSTALSGPGRIVNRKRYAAPDDFGTLLFIDCGMCTAIHLLEHIGLSTPVIRDRLKRAGVRLAHLLDEALAE